MQVMSIKDPAQLCNIRCNSVQDKPHGVSRNRAFVHFSTELGWEGREGLVGGAWKREDWHHKEVEGRTNRVAWALLNAKQQN